jgi:branched-chain amino acid transport system permease protein
MEKKRSPWLVVAFQIGLIGGVAALTMSLVGMVEEFAQRDIIAGVIEMGQTLLLLTLLGVGYFTAHRLADRPLPLRLAGALVAGVVPAAMLYGLVLLIVPLGLRLIFLNASPGLIKILTFDQPGITGPLYMLGAGASQALAGGVIRVLPKRLGGAVLQGLSWVALIGLLQDLLRVTLTYIPSVGNAVAWMFGGRNEKGLSVAGAVVVFLLFAVGVYLRGGERAGGPGRLASMPPQARRAVQAGLLVASLFVIYIVPNVLGPYLTEVTNSVGLFVLMGLGLNIVVGYAGLLDLGYVAFYALGAYTVGVLTSTAVGNLPGQIVWGPQVSFWVALVGGVLVSVIAGIILGVPVLKMRGDYLAIVTLGFGEIIRILAGSDFLKPYIGGSQGIVEVGIGQIGNVVFNRPQTLYYVIAAACILAAFISWRLRDSRMGRAWKALREDEDVAQAMGIHLVSTKLLAFATGAAFAGLSGAIFASKIGSIYPHSFKLLVSINVLSLIIVGGMGSLPGVFVGALALVGLPELLREFSEYRILIYGALLIVMMLTRPEGLWPEATRRQELHEAMGTDAEPGVEAVASPGGAPTAG